jgi:hypothetical protein
MKRQRGRNRGGGGGSGGGGGNKPTQNANRAFDSNGPEGVKVRGNAQHVFEKYQQLARDAITAGDRVLGENHLQHAEHYFRLLRAIQPNRPASEILGRDQFASGYDIDFEDESGQPQGEPYDPNAGAEQIEGRQDNGGQDRNRGDWQPRDDRPRDDRPRDDRPRDDRPRNNDGGPRDRDRWQNRDGRDNRNRNRDDRPRDDRPRDDRPRDDRPRDERPRDDRPRDDRPRDDRPRDDRPRDDRPRAESDEPRRDRYDRDRDRDRGERQDRAERDPMPVVQPQGDPAPAERGPMLRDSDGGASHAPAFLQARPAAPTADAGEEKPKPRRRRAPRSFEAGEGAPPPETEEA